MTNPLTPDYFGSLLEIYAATLAISSALRVSFFGCLTDRRRCLSEFRLELRVRLPRP